MVFSNSVFLFFFLPVILVLYYFPLWRKCVTFRNVLLLAASLVFYAWGEPLYVFLMIASIVVNYLFGRWVSSYNKSAKDKAKIKKGKLIVLFAVVYNIGILFVFKYLDWMLTSLHIVGSDTLNIILPIGISFYTFQALSYVIDVYRGKDEAQKNIINVGLYIAFFPQLIAGPIVRYGTIAEQLKNRTHNFDKFSEGVRRFVIGLSKKLILANQLASVSDLAFGTKRGELTVTMAWVGALSFMLQLYFDFSGYSDMAIGLGKMFGFEFNENFNYPYISRSITEYWRRWHISLGEWFRDYVYYPLSTGKAVSVKKFVYRKTNNRKLSGRISSFFVLFVVWMATGLWHGANLTFVVWGLLQFVFIFWEQYRKPIKNDKAAAVIGWTTTFLIVLITKVVFKSENMGQAVGYYGSMLGLAGNKFIDNATVYWIGQYLMFILAGLFFCFPILRSIGNHIDSKCGRAVRSVKAVVSALSLSALLFLDISYSIGGGYNPFIYFNF